MILSLVSFKGGAGKATTAIMLSAYLEGMAKTALVDGDLNFPRPDGDKARETINRIERQLFKTRVPELAAYEEALKQ